MADLDLDAIRERTHLKHAITLLRLVHAATDHDGRIQQGCVISDGRLLNERVRQIWRNDIPDLLAAVESLTAERDDLRALFDLQWTRMAAATVRWREEAPAERALVMPDLGALLDWLLRGLDERDEARAAAKQYGSQP